MVSAVPGSPASRLTRVDAVKQLLDLTREARAWYRDRLRWSVSIDASDRLYEVAHTWFVDGAELGEAPRALSARLRDRNAAGAHPVDEPVNAGVEFYYNDRRDRRVVIDGHPVTVSMTIPESAGLAQMLSDLPSAAGTPRETLHFHARSRAGQQAVMAMLERLAATNSRRQPALHIVNNWGGWTHRSDVPARPIESVVLARGQMERLRADFETFLGSEAEHVRRGIPWHRGYLLHGAPGTGKTSVIRALASHFGLDLWYVPLGDLSKDASLLSLISDVTPRSILLLEDVDVFQATRVRDDKASSVSMAGLLNALDGVATPHGMISVLTSNDISAIDPALLRAGRIDVREEIGLPDADQLARLWAQFYDRPVPPYTLTFEGTTADACELFKRTPDPEEALRQLSPPREVAIDCWPGFDR